MHFYFHHRYLLQFSFLWIIHFFSFTSGARDENSVLESNFKFEWIEGNRKIKFSGFFPSNFLNIRVKSEIETLKFAKNDFSMRKRFHRLTLFHTNFLTKPIFPANYHFYSVQFNDLKILKSVFIKSARLYNCNVSFPLNIFR